MASNDDASGKSPKKKSAKKKPAAKKSAAKKKAAPKKKPAVKKKPSVALDADAAQEAVEHVRQSQRGNEEETPETEEEAPRPPRRRGMERRISAETGESGRTSARGQGDETARLPKATTLKATVSSRTTRGVRNKDITSFLRQLIMLLESGTPLLKALSTLAQRGEHHGIRNLVAGITEYVEAGNPLWQAFAREDKYFSPVFVNLIKASEATGTLAVVLNRLVSYRERREMLRQRIQSAALYPIILLLACFAVIVIISKVVIPQFRAIFDKFDIELNAFSVFFMGMSDFIANWWPAFIVVAVGLVLFYRFFWVRSPVRRVLTDRVKLKLPIVGNISQKNAVVEFTRTFALLQRSGLSMLVTLDLVRNAISNRAYISSVQEMRESVERGEGLERPLRDGERRGLFPAVVVDMLVTGEETGRMDTIADQIADTLEEEVKIAVDTVGEALQPIITVFMGFVVIMIALALFGPLVEMIEKITAGGAL